MAFAPSPKAPGNPIRSADWNELVDETKRLETAKFDVAGGKTGPLTVQGRVDASTLAVTGQATVGGTLDVTGGTTLRSPTSVSGNLSVTGSASMSGTVSASGAATFGAGGSFAGNLRAGAAGTANDAALDVVGNARIGTGSTTLRVTSQFENFPSGATGRAEIANDTANERTLLLAGNRSGPNANIRRVSVRDRLEVHGPSCATSFCNLSDGRLKTDVVDVPDALERLSRLRGVSFRWQEDVAPAGQALDSALGVVAQEVDEVFPELVSSMGNDDHLTVDYSGLTAVLVEAVKQLKADNERLLERLDVLEAAVSDA
jgi:hypothetical protein